MAMGSGESAYDILQLALASIDLSGIYFDDLEDFSLSMKENRSRFGEPVTMGDGHLLGIILCVSIDYGKFT